MCVSNVYVALVCKQRIRRIAVAVTHVQNCGFLPIAAIPFCHNKLCAVVCIVFTAAHARKVDLVVFVTKRNDVRILLTVVGVYVVFIQEHCRSCKSVSGKFRALRLPDQIFFS